MSVTHNTAALHLKQQRATEIRQWSDPCNPDSFSRQVHRPGSLLGSMGSTARSLRDYGWFGKSSCLCQRWTSSISWCSSRILHGTPCKGSHPTQQGNASLLHPFVDSFPPTCHWCSAMIEQHAIDVVQWLPIQNSGPVNQVTIPKGTPPECLWCHSNTFIYILHYAPSLFLKFLNHHGNSVRRQTGGTPTMLGQPWTLFGQSVLPIALMMIALL